MSSICLIFSKIKVASMEKNYQVRRQSELIHGSKTYLIHEKLQFHAQSPNTFKTVFSSCFSWALWITVLWFAECSWFFFNIKQYWYIFFPNNDKQVDWTYFFLNFTRKITILITKKKKKNIVQNLDSLILYNLDYCFMKVITFQYLLTQI